MKHVSEAWKAHLGGSLTHLVELVRVMRRDGKVLGLTTHDRDLTYDGVIYRSGAGFSRKGVWRQKSQRENESMRIEVALDGDAIASGDVATGVYDGARVDFLLGCWSDPSLSPLWLRSGWIGEVAEKDGAWSAELRPFADRLDLTLGETYTPECRHELGDARCAVDLQVWTHSGCVVGLIDTFSFSEGQIDQPSGFFNRGFLIWTSGANTMRKQEVQVWNLEERRITLRAAPPFSVSVGDTFQIVAGCDKCLGTCRDRFANAARYGGFPYLPGIGRLLAYPQGRA